MWLQYIAREVTDLVNEHLFESYTYSKPGERSKMERLGKIITVLTIFAKSSNWNLWEGSKYVWMWLNNALWQGSEYDSSRIYQGYAGCWICLNRPEYAWIMSQYAWTCRTNVKYDWMCRHIAEKQCTICQSSECVWCST